MDQGPDFAGVVEQEMIDQGRQAGSQAADGEVACPEVAEHGQACFLRQHGRHAQAERRGITALRLMPGVMTAQAGALHLLQGAGCFAGNLPRRCSEGFAEDAMGQAQLSRGHGLAGAEFQKQVAQIARIRLVDGMAELQAHVETDTGHFDQGGVHAVGGRAGGQSQDPAAGGVHGF